MLLCRCRLVLPSFRSFNIFPPSLISNFKLAFFSRSCSFSLRHDHCLHDVVCLLKGFFFSSLLCKYTRFTCSCSHFSGDIWNLQRKKPVLKYIYSNQRFHLHRKKTHLFSLKVIHYKFLLHIIELSAFCINFSLLIYLTQRLWLFIKCYFHAIV